MSMRHRPRYPRLALIGLTITLPLALCGPSWGQDAATRVGHPRYESHPHPTTSDTTRFRTNRKSEVVLPLPEEKDAFTFAVFGDRTGGPPEGIEILKAAVADANLFEPDLVMTVGDMVEGYNDTAAWLPQMLEYKVVMSKLLCPWFPVAGNHDIYWRGKARPTHHHERNYELHFGPLWYSFQHKNCWFIVLFSDEGDRRGNKSFSEPQLQRMSAEQFTWLQDALKTARGADHVFVFLHHPRWLGGGYGDDWNKVHRALVAAGNVKMVFAGHIHRMRYDGPRDGIEYVTLATVGGGQKDFAPAAGYLHHFHMVTVRKQQIALACLPVGEVMDVRGIDGTVSDDVGLLARTRPRFRAREPIGAKGSSTEPLILELHNPTSRAVEFTVQVAANQRHWSSTPDHLHRKVAPGDTAQSSVTMHRLWDEVDDEFQLPQLVVEADYLARHARIALRPQQLVIPVRLDLPAPARSEREAAIQVGNGHYVVVDSEALELPKGPMTVECWCKPKKLAERSGLISKTEQSGYGLFLDDGHPKFLIFLGDEYVRTHADKRLLAVDRWHHLAGVFDGREVRLYADGKLVDSASGQATRVVNHLPLVIGGEMDRNGTIASPYDGLVDAVRISTVARYDGPAFTPERRPEADADTVLLLNFDAFIGTLAYDESPQAAHARRVGTPTLAAE